MTPTTAPIKPSGPATLEVDVSEGDYEITASGGEAGEDERRARGTIEPAAVKVGAARPSAQSTLLQP